MEKQIYARWFRRVFLLLVACVIPFSGVSAADRKEIRIGAVNSMTGWLAMGGVPEKWGYEQAIADINKKGGIFVKELGKKLPVRLIFVDDKSTPDGGAAGTEKLIKMDKVDCILGSDDSSINIAVATIVQKYKVFMMQGMFPERFEIEKYKWVDNYFFSALGASEVPFKIWNQLPEADKIKRPVLMTEDNQDGQAFGDGFRMSAKKYGYEFVVDAPYGVGSKDFSSHILKMKAAKADALLFFGGATDGITLLRQIKDQQLKLRYIHGWRGFWPTEFLKAMGSDTDYIIHDGFWAENNGVPGSKEVGQRFTKQFGQDSVTAGYYYACAQILAQAIEKAGSADSAKIRDLVFSGNFAGKNIMGDFKFNEKGMFNTESLALQWWKGERMPVWPPLPNVWKVKMIPAQ